MRVTAKRLKKVEDVLFSIKWKAIYMILGEVKLLGAIKFTELIKSDDRRYIRTISSSGLVGIYNYNGVLQETAMLERMSIYKLLSILRAITAGRYKVGLRDG